MSSSWIARSNGLVAVFSLWVCITLTGCNSSVKTTFNTKTKSSVIGGGSSTGDGIPSKKVQLSWTRNPEKAVNSAGGGYKVYYSRTSGFTPPSGTAVDVPYVSGALAPTSASIEGLASGTWYFRVIAYSSLKPAGSSASPAITVQVP